jgi:hypothetical protein
MIRSSIERSAIAIAMALVIAMLATLATAQTSAPTDPKEMARTLGEEGLALHAKGEFAQAYDKFATAERIQHSPVLVLWMARSKRAVGALRAARPLYERVSNEALPPDASEKWHNAQRAAKKELGALRIPTLSVRLAPGAPSNVTLHLDGTAIAPGRAIELDPGDHLVRATAPTEQPVERRVHLEEGRHETVEIAFASAEAQGSVVPGAVVLAVGLAAVTAGAITGGIALKLAGEVEDGCVGQQCLLEDEGKAGDANALGIASTVLFIAGGAASAAGVVLLVLRPGPSSSSSEVAISIAPAGVSAVVRF